MFVFVRTRQVVVAAALLLLLLAAGLVPAARFARKRHAPVHVTGSTARREVALLLEVDGRAELLPGVLGVLEEHGVPATFFVTGEWALENPGLVREMARRGYGLGSHSFANRRLGALSRRSAAAELERTAEVLAALTGKRPRFFLPPGGEVSRAVLEAARKTRHEVVLGLPVIRGLSAEELFGKLHNGAPLLLSLEAAATALPALLEAAAVQGYRVVPLEKLIPEQQ